MDSSTRSRTLPQPVLLLCLSFLHPTLLESTWKKIVRPNAGRTRKQRGLRKQKWALETGPSVRRLEIISLQESGIAVGDVCAADMTPGDGRPWLPAALLLLQVPGCWSLRGPTSVTGTVGGSLSVQCQYEEKFKENVKYWCKTPCMGDIMKTEEADKEVRSGRVSIRDQPANLTFTVTLENLTEGDGGTYRCGIDTSWLSEYLLDLTFRVVLSVTPGADTVPGPRTGLGWPQGPCTRSCSKVKVLGTCAQSYSEFPSTVVCSETSRSLSLSGPSTVMGTVGGSLSVQCQYEEKYKTFTKYWCRQPCLPSWNQTVATGRSEEKMRSGRVSIVDHAENLTFTVTLENLTADDAGKYRCGIATILQEEGLHGFLPDLFFQVQVFVSPRSQVVSIHFLLLILLKVPLFLMMLSVILWVNRSQWAICGTQSRPDEDNMQPSLSINILSRDTATHTRRGRTSVPKPPISSHLVPQNWSLLSRVHFLLLVILKVSLLLTMLTDVLGVSSLLVGTLTKRSFSPSCLWICCPDTQLFRGEKRRFTTSDLPIFLLMA
ncbi:uncharacterized protein LOC131815663 isoform X1 [Mustela lutreola]|uniref:uncharacterized protein LOC131815663 isoform X1 n=1 Tax=Mustela lutreola TaxID=9666 RepID=UPI0027975A09|nr:uncharacterized protein LOC131815663 isoform X1 [Mustela lutreola]